MSEEKNKSNKWVLWIGIIVVVIAIVFVVFKQYAQKQALSFVTPAFSWDKSIIYTVNPSAFACSITF